MRALFRLGVSGIRATPFLHSDWPPPVVPSFVTPHLVSRPSDAPTVSFHPSILRFSPVFAQGGKMTGAEDPFPHPISSFPFVPFSSRPNVPALDLKLKLGSSSAQAQAQARTRTGSPFISVLRLHPSPYCLANLPCHRTANASIVLARFLSPDIARNSYRLGP